LDVAFFLLYSTDGWKKRWVESKHQPDYGKFQLTAGKFYGDKEKDKGKY
jgi:calreticulin